MLKDVKYREIPYNYTSFSDKEIILKYFDQETWDILTSLRTHRVTGRSARLFYEIIGDLFIIDRNPYIFNDFLDNPRKPDRLKKMHRARLDTIKKNADNEMVLKLLDKVQDAHCELFSRFAGEKQKRHRVMHALRGVTPASNISFSAFDKVLHVTDATDWRVEYPDAVVYPDTIEQTSGIVRKAVDLGMKIIPRGGGTGLTGGAVPVFRNTLVINTEKLNRIRGIEVIEENGLSIPVVTVEAGAVTDHVMEHCLEHGYIFATDPTSAWASTIGGNIAENAGGKKAVMWGTTIDNIYSFQIINARGHILEVKRREHPHRKILPEDRVVFDVCRIHKNGSRENIKSITLTGTDIRKKGVGKDITNKALGGVPGIQKEGGDGIIVSARFVLYTPFKFVRTLCLEFFGKNMINAAKAIMDITEAFSRDQEVYLTALEHFDEKYVTAIDYRNKSSRSEIPKAVLLIDIESNNEAKLENAAKYILDLVKNYNTDGFFAKTPEEREKFWKDRKNMSAIAKHTNAFKLNEDVVIPLEALPRFSDYIEMLNKRKELENSRLIAQELIDYLVAQQSEEDEFLAAKISNYIDKLKAAADRFDYFSKNVESLSIEIQGVTSEQTAGKPLFSLIRDGVVTIESLDEIMAGITQAFHGYSEIIEASAEIIKEFRKKLIIIATHMHAGDGNIHVNIPVNSNDYPMMREADETAGMIMEEVKTMGGVISGEHGIGLTKLKYIDQRILDDYAAYKIENDPEDVFNPGKLRSNFPQSMIYTPSLNLLEREAFILEAADLEKLTTSISACVRCGKCKDKCNTHFPGGTMFYNPRNKILAVSLIVEAVLYEAQTNNTLGLRNFTMLRDISNHCTICHNCLAPCPVKIDFGEVTLSIKRLLVERKRAKYKPIIWATLFYVKTRGYKANKLFRLALLRAGYSAQRLGYIANIPFRWLTGKVLPFIDAMLDSGLPAAGKKSLREALDLSAANAFYSFQNSEKAPGKSVVYFPGCGSERMFSDISIAVIALLYNAGVRVVIPPEYLCCGYPLLYNGRSKEADMKSYENRVIFHRMSDIIGYMDIQDVIVSCGTCHEMLGKYQIENIFPGSALIDINEFIAREGICKGVPADETILYHEPCHSPLKTLGADRTFEALFGRKPVVIPNCCGEGGTLALSTPEISGIIRKRKRWNVMKASGDKKAMVLTTCPSCVQGLSRRQGGTCFTGKSLVQYIAEETLGKSWRRDFIRHVKKHGSVERIIF